VVEWDKVLKEYESLKSFTKKQLTDKIETLKRNAKDKPDRVHLIPSNIDGKHWILVRPVKGSIDQ